MSQQINIFLLLQEKLSVTEKILLSCKAVQELIQFLENTDDPGLVNEYLHWEHNCCSNKIIKEVSEEQYTSVLVTRPFPYFEVEKGKCLISLPTRWRENIPDHIRHNSQGCLV